VSAAAWRFQMPKAGGAMASAKKIADRAKAKAAKSKGSDSSSDELESTCSRVSSSDEERPPSKKTKKKSAVSEEPAAKVINQFTFS
jgi:hypothetical protein